MPSEEAAVRQRLVDEMPVVETAVRIPSGDLVQRVYAAVAGGDDIAVVEFENASPLPVVLALDAPDGDRWLRGARPPARVDGAARHYPVTHRTTMRFLAGLAAPLVAIRGTIPTAAEVARGWRRHLEHGERFVVPDTNRQRRIDRDRAQHVLGGDAPELAAVRGMLIDERRRAIALCPALPDEWIGGPLEVHEARVRKGTLSFAVRWHNDRPALLWEMHGIPRRRRRLCAPDLDPAWSTTDESGEALLAPLGRASARARGSAP